MSIEKYIQQFSHLRTDVNHKRWTQATCYRAPHKPILLLSIMDLFSQGLYRTNFISISPELGDIFASYWEIVVKENRRGNLVLPFFHMRSSPFWHLLPQGGKQEVLQESHQVDSLNQLQSLILGVELDEDLFSFLQVEDTRNVLRSVLIETYFESGLRAALLEQGEVNLQSYIYSQQLIEKVHKQIKENPESSYQTAVRDQGFRRAVVDIYDHRCSFCGVRMLTTDGHSVVEAAHIIPWSISHNDDPRNGIALCRLCHWTFDEGMASISNKYTVLLSTEMRVSSNFPGHLLTFEGRSIIGPLDQSLWPNLQCLSWHRQNTFRT